MQSAAENFAKGALLGRGARLLYLAWVGPSSLARASVGKNQTMAFCVEAACLRRPRLELKGPFRKSLLSETAFSCSARCLVSFFLALLLGSRWRSPFGSFLWPFGFRLARFLVCRLLVQTVVALVCVMARTPDWQIDSIEEGVVLRRIREGMRGPSAPFPAKLASGCSAHGRVSKAPPVRVGRSIGRWQRDRLLILLSLVPLARRCRAFGSFSGSSSWSVQRPEISSSREVAL